MGTNAPLYVVVGASGVVGMFTCRELLQRGGNVRAVMRRPEKHGRQKELEDMIAYFPRGKRGNLTVVKGDVTDIESLKAVMEGATVVIFAAAGNKYSGKNSPYDVDNLGVGNCAEAAKAAGVKKMVLVSSILVSEHHHFGLTRFWMNITRWRMMDHKLAGEYLLRKSGIPYTIVRPGSLYLTHDGTGGKLRLRAGQGDQLRGQISRADAAAVIAAVAIDPVLALNATFEVTEIFPPVKVTEKDDGTRWEYLQHLVEDAPLGENEGGTLLGFLPPLPFAGDVITLPVLGQLTRDTRKMGPERYRRGAGAPAGGVEVAAAAGAEGPVIAANQYAGQWVASRPWERSAVAAEEDGDGEAEVGGWDPTIDRRGATAARGA